MTLDDAIRHVRILANAGKGVDSEALRMLVDHVAASHALGDVFAPPGLDAQIAQAREVQRQALRDQFAMHAPVDRWMSYKTDLDAQGTAHHASLAYAWADAMLAARDAK